ncbi:cytochrome c-type biogenesis protein [Natronobacillus azotifigens]|uniref:Sulfite exporter TauE/SafE family protein n=1 Tax=Natronobacillus azotifigens TaxID=472978 RepID=A0A9J6R8Z2_9BACI|nr:cytochrome c biogenesis protein CcdA [Natronobacillus azotifigens]MCZ0701724.1 sulfite exporter TauE/SafE family protein [Natronobacillus azotifigens]
MQQVTDLSTWLALGAGILSFLSPCTLPVFPAYLSYITGVSVKELQGDENRKLKMRMSLHAVFFLLGVSIIFFSLGIGASFFGNWLQSMLAGNSGILIQRVTGIFLMITGLMVGGWITIIPLMKEKRIRFKSKPGSIIGSLFVGIGFAAGWTPCIGPIFASILLVAANNPAEGALYTMMYIIGFSLPFFLSTYYLSFTKVLVKYSEKIMKIGGALIIVFGILLFTGQITRISIFLLRLIEDTWFSNLG